MRNYEVYWSILEHSWTKLVDLTHFRMVLEHFRTLLLFSNTFSNGFTIFEWFLNIFEWFYGKYPSKWLILGQNGAKQGVFSPFQPKIEGFMGNIWGFSRICETSRDIRGTYASFAGHLQGYAWVCGGLPGICRAFGTETRPLALDLGLWQGIWAN